MHVEHEEQFRVLVVDDERIIADSLALILNRSGFAALAVYSGQSALAHAPEWKPSALITDVVMPGLNGIETARAVIRQFPECHVILFSGHATLNVIHQHGENPFEILPKPVGPQQLLHRLNALRMGGSALQAN